MRTKGRRPMGDIQLRNGFYIEVCNKGVKKGMKIWSENRKGMEDKAAMYDNYKEVIILGEYKDGMPFIELPVPSTIQSGTVLAQL